jgi:hypothetical protein
MLLKSVLVCIAEVVVLPGRLPLSIISIDPRCHSGCDPAILPTVKFAIGIPMLP